ncbi:MAG TPA: hypothetical protein VMV94_14605 [Phycisphaerae bacterium]|nr:hypothetical protein [Phycisphaerae bacterium]
MARFSRSAMGIVSRLLIGTMLATAGGCGVDRLAPTLPEAIPGFTLDDLKNIQKDERLTTDEKREQIRTAVGAPNDADGDRLVDFLLNLTVP